MGVLKDFCKENIIFKDKSKANIKENFKDIFKIKSSQFQFNYFTTSFNWAWDSSVQLVSFFLMQPLVRNFDLVFETMLWNYELLNIDRQDRDKVSQRTLFHPTIF